MNCVVKFDPLLAKQYLSRTQRAVTELMPTRAGNAGYVSPDRRAGAGEGDALRLDAMETGFAKTAMLGGGFGRIATYMRLDGPAVQPQALAACLSALQARHPYLRRCIERTRRGLAFAPMEMPIPVLQHEARGDLDIDQLWRRVECRPLRVGEPLARVHCVRFTDEPRRTDLIVEMEHCISDGASLMFFTGELVEQLSAYAETGAPHSRAPLGLSASVNARSAQELGGLRKALTRLAQHLLLGTSGGIRKIPSLVPRDTRFGHADCHTHIIRERFSAEESKQLRAAAKARGASVSSVLGAACSLGIAGRLFAQQGRKKKRYVTISYAASLRHRYMSPLENVELGLHASGVDPCLGLSPESCRSDDPSVLWTSGKLLKNELDQAMRPGRGAHWALAFMTGPAMQFPVRVPRAKMPCSMVLTDCARYAAPPQVGSYTLKDLRPFLNGLAFNNPFFSLTPTVEGGLMLTLFAPVPAFAEEDLHAIVEAAASRVRAALKAECSASPQKLPPEASQHAA